MATFYSQNNSHYDNRDYHNYNSFRGQTVSQPQEQDKVLQDLKLLLEQSGSFLDVPSRNAIYFILNHYEKSHLEKSYFIERECRNLLQSLQSSPTDRCAEFYHLRNSLKQLLQQMLRRFSV